MNLILAEHTMTMLFNGELPSVVQFCNYTVE